MFNGTCERTGVSLRHLPWALIGLLHKSCVLGNWVRTEMRAIKKAISHVLPHPFQTFFFDIWYDVDGIVQCVHYICSGARRGKRVDSISQPFISFSAVIFSPAAGSWFLGLNLVHSCDARNAKLILSLLPWHCHGIHLDPCQWCRSSVNRESERKAILGQQVAARGRCEVRNNGGRFTLNDKARVNIWCAFTIEPFLIMKGTGEC